MFNKKSIALSGISLELQEVIIDDITLSYYAEITTNKKLTKIEELLIKRFEFLDKLLLKAKEQNYENVDKLKLQINVLKTNKIKLVELVEDNLLNKLGIHVLENSIIKEKIKLEETYDFRSNLPFYKKNKFTINPYQNISLNVKFFLLDVIDVKIKEINFKVEKEIEFSDMESNNDTMLLINRKVMLQSYIRVNPKIVYNDLLNVLAKSCDNPGLNYSEFKINRNLELHPKIQLAIHLLEKEITFKPYFLNVVGKLKTMNDYTQQQFLKTFNKVFTNHIDVYESVISNGKLFLRVEYFVLRDEISLLIKKWKDNISVNNNYLLNNNKVSISEVSFLRFVEIYNDILKPINITTFKGKKFRTIDKQKLTYNNFKEIFEILGIDFSKQHFLALKDGVYIDGRAKSLSDQLTHSNGYIKIIYKRFLYIYHSNLDARLLFDDNVFKNIAKFFIKFDVSLSNLSHTNNNGDVVHGITNNQYFMERIIDLKFNPYLLKNLLINNFSKSSHWLSQLYNKYNGTLNNSSFSKYFKYAIVDGYALKNSKKTFEQLDNKEFIQLGLTLFYNNGLSILNEEMPIHRFIITALSDKFNFFTIQAIGKKYNLLNGVMPKEQIDFLYSQLVEPEVFRIIETQNNETNNIANYHIWALKFILIPELNNIKELWEEKKLKNDILVNPHYRNVINKTIMSHIISECREIYICWEKLELISKGLSGVYGDKMNYIDLNYLKTIKSTTEKATYVVLNYVINYMVTNANMQMLVFNDPAFTFRLNNNNNNILSSFKNEWEKNKITDLYKECKNDFSFPYNSKFNVIIIKGNTHRNNIEYLSSLWKDQFDINKILKFYENGSIEFISLKEHLYRLIYSGTICKVIALKIYKNYLKTKQISKSDLSILLKPMKILYFHTYFDNNIMRTLSFKCLSIPLIKQFTIDKNLDFLRSYLENSKSKVQAIITESGVKIGGPKNPLNLFNNNGEIIPESLNSELAKDAIIKNIPREGYGIQS